MLPVYKAISFVYRIEVGAKTKPWVVIVRTPNGLRPYVVKVFQTPFIDVWDSVTNEVSGNILATEFNLKTPTPALIDFDYDFIKTLSPELTHVLNLADGRLKFATELLEGVSQFDTSSYSSVDARAIVDIDTLFGFDNLICNQDRTGQPANLLVGSDDVYLIDHEMAFAFRGDVREDLRTWQWPSVFSSNHIFFGYLKKSWLIKRQEYFNEFEEYLRLLNPQMLSPYFQQLSDIGYSTKNHESIMNYLSLLKGNSANFVNILKAKIS